MNSTPGSPSHPESLAAHKQRMLDYARELEAAAAEIEQEYNVSNATLAAREATDEHKQRMSALKAHIRQISGEYVPHVV